MTRRDILYCIRLVSGVAGLHAGAHVRVFAQPPSGGSASEPEALFALAVTSLRRGVRFEQAARNLEAAVAGKPEDFRYHLALGCAYAGRAIAVASALHRSKRDRDIRKRYPLAYEKWERAQADRTNPGYGLPPPALPPPLTTPDDGQPFLLTDEEAGAEFRSLTVRALRSWEVARERVAGGAERAEVLRVCGWGFVLLIREVWTFKDFALPEGIRDRFTYASAIRDFAEVVTLRPDDVTAWLNYGDACYFAPAETRWKEEPRAVKVVAQEAYRRALERDPRQPTVAFRLYELNRDYGLTSEAGGQESLAWLRHAMRYAPQYFLYRSTFFLECLLLAARVAESGGKERLGAVKELVGEGCRNVRAGTDLAMRSGYEMRIPELLAGATWEQSPELNWDGVMFSADGLALAPALRARTLCSYLISCGETDVARDVGATLLRVGECWLEIFRGVFAARKYDSRFSLLIPSIKLVVEASVEIQCAVNDATGRNAENTTVKRDGDVVLREVDRVLADVAARSR